MLTIGRTSARRTRPRKGNVDARLGELERSYEAAFAAAQGRSAEERSAAALDMVRRIIASLGVEQKETESLSDAFARALGLSSKQLMAELEQFASGWRRPRHG